MPRKARYAPGCVVYHVLHRAVAKLPLFRKDVESLQVCIQRSRPFGEERWETGIASRLDLLHTLRSEGRPRKKHKPEN
jgi:hypothetical protein